MVVIFYLAARFGAGELKTGAVLYLATPIRSLTVAADGWATISACVRGVRDAEAGFVPLRSSSPPAA